MGRPAPTSNDEPGRRMHDEPTGADDNRIGTLTLDLLFAALVEAVRERDQARDALRQIRDLPTQHDLLFNAEAKALHYIAARALDQVGGVCHDELGRLSR